MAKRSKRTPKEIERYNLKQSVKHSGKTLAEIHAQTVKSKYTQPKSIGKRKSIVKAQSVGKFTVKSKVSPMKAFSNARRTTKTLQQKAKTTPLRTNKGVSQRYWASKETALAQKRFNREYAKALKAKLPERVAREYAKTRLVEYKYGHGTSGYTSIKLTKRAVISPKAGMTGEENAVYHLKNIQNMYDQIVANDARETLSSDMSAWMARGDISSSEMISQLQDTLDNEQIVIPNAQFHEIKTLIYSVAQGGIEQTEAEAKIGKILNGVLNKKANLDMKGDIIKQISGV